MKIRRDGVSAVLGAIAVAIAIFALGGATRGAQAAVALAAAGALVPLVTSRRVLGRYSPLVLLLALAAALCALQIIPLPHALVAWLEPVGSAYRDDGAALLGTSPAQTLSLDPPATLRALAFFITLLALAIVALRVASSEQGRYRILATIGALGALTAIVSGVHALLGATKLYGFIDLHFGGPPLLGPLINDNHLGCLLAMCALVSLGLALHRRQAAWLRAAWLASAGACAFAALATYSRGAVLGLAIGAFVTCGVLIAQRFIALDTPRRRRAGFLTSSLPVGVVAVCAVIVVLYAGSEGISQQLASTHFDELHAPRSKFAAWHSAATVIEESPWVGIGRGALEPVFTRVHPASAYATYAEVENEYIQAVVDFGVPAAVVLAMLALWLGVIAVRRWRDGPLAAGALGALVAVMLQSNVDFGVELLGVAAPLVAILATLAYVPVREGKPQAKLVVRGVRIVHVVALVGVAWLLVGTTATRSLEEDHRALGEARDLTLADVQQLVERHPLDYFNFARAAELMEHTGDAKAVRVLNHALALHPTHPGLHLMAARLLYRAHFPDQAALEYAQAVIPTRDKRALLGEIASRLSPAQAAAAIPSSADWRPELARELEELGHTDVELAWLVRSLELAPHDLHPCEQLYQLAAKHGERASLDALLAHCAEYQPATDVLLALAKSLETKHEYAEALKLLGDVENWHGRTDEQLAAWFAACDAHAGLGEWDEARRCVRRLDASGIVPPARASEIAGWLEQLDQARAAAALRGSGSGSAAGHAAGSAAGSGATGTTPAPR